MQLRGKEKTPGTVWALSGQRYALLACPVGYRLGNDTGYESQQCQKCGDGQYIQKSDDPSARCFNCPAGYKCPNGAPPIKADEVAVAIKFAGLSKTDVVSNPSVSTALVTALSGNTAVDSSMIVISEICDAAGVCQSLTSQRRSTLMQLRQTTASSTVKFVISSASGNAASLVNTVNSPSFSSYLTSSLSSELAAQSIGSINIAAEVQGAKVESDNKALLYEGWVYEFRNRGESHLVGCPRGKLVVNSSIDTQTCFGCPAGTYSLDSTDNCGKTSCADRECSACAIGARCTGGDEFSPLVADSEWKKLYEVSAFVMRVEKCPPGYVLVRDQARAGNDECTACLTNSYRLEYASYTQGIGVTDTQAVRTGSLDLCLPCPPGTVCEGKAQVLDLLNVKVSSLAVLMRVLASM
jgi:hypothetical protein